ncbi:BON domain-containing protein [Paraburkholderia kururiensis]|uniref:BON domain-containing protein n=1 Tax=Paraburkholderia kururiensis TaxID=984307 RepID=A0ABZ0WK26_9BURK|nr:BON domain-containing protein [Paraburkholderia kururiensis]WQD77698.1 BON domain-containing protein [Paraburkholderia kururiensis]
MKAIHAIRMAVGALVVATSVGAWAQASDPGTDTANTAASAKASKKAARSANRALQKKVRAALARAKGVSVANITVRANNGAVTLAGTVPDASQIDLATQAAQGVAGVTSVKNALTVRSEGGQ